MYLEKLDIQGFKSFANKNKLVFSGLIGNDKKGLTAIVGPNGSGKSNVADAIRWALGEQSVKTLRGKKSEDVIFSGSDQKSKLGMAEVSLYLNNREKTNNTDASPEKIEKESDLDKVISGCPEISITRRLYRNGDSEYLLNNNRVRLADIQMLLAKANFGQKTYSVIGQGIVENFLNTSAADRKDFFDEATGVKQFQIKRDSALNKLEHSYENLQQVDMLLTEISPRLRSLTRQVDKLNKRSQLEIALKENQLNYYHNIWQDIHGKLDNFNSQYLEKEKVKMERDRKLAKVNEELNKIKTTDNNEEINEIKPELQELYNTKNNYLKQLARIQAELEHKLESQGQFDLSWLNNKQAELSRELEGIKESLNTLLAEHNNGQEEVLKTELNELNKKIQTAHNQLQELDKIVSSSQDKESSKKEISQIISTFLKKLDEIEIEESLEKIKELLQSAKSSFKNQVEPFLDTDSSEKLESIKKVQEDIIAFNEQKQNVINQLNEYRFKNSSKEEKRQALQERQNKLESDLADIELKISKQSLPKDSEGINKEKVDIEEKIEEINKRIREKEELLEELNRAKEKEKSLIFDFQRNLQSLQSEINIITSELNELKINATRQETKLEDLEENIRNDELDLSTIRQHQTTEGDIDLERVHKKILSLKGQLEMIGGIDPETEKEYKETKERFDFLDGQTSDLKETIKSLEEIIRELDINIKGRFDKEFKIISEKFNEYFKILFNGGSAKISKVMVDDLNKEKKEEGSTENEEVEEKVDETAEQLKKIKFFKKHNAVGLAGIDIQAIPPGKKIQSVTMLSGGERALTAIALICAIISANPSPFVVLDEVDAALDEANSERLAKILDDLSHKTQFIVVTHNRASMRRASILYGVTMGTDGVSKLLSVKLDDIKEE